MSETVSLRSVEAYGPILEDDPITLGVVDRIHRPSSPAIEWGASEHLSAYTDKIRLTSQKSESSINLDVEQAARLEDFFKRFYADREGVGIKREEEIDCHAFLGFTAFNKDPGGGTLSVALDTTPVDDLENNTPYCLMGQVRPGKSSPMHSFFTTNNPPETLGVFGISQPLVVAQLSEILRYAKQYGGADSVNRAVSQAEALDRPNETATFYR